MGSDDPVGHDDSQRVAGSVLAANERGNFAIVSKWRDFKCLAAAEAHLAQFTNSPIARNTRRGRKAVVGRTA